MKKKFVKVNIDNIGSNKIINDSDNQYSCETFFNTIVGDVCVDVFLTTGSWGSENFWVLGTCSNTALHENYKTRESECCLPPGEYTLECKDSHGDGWHGGSITINGKTYCRNFNSGSLETHEILIGYNTKPEGIRHNVLRS